MNYNYHTHTYLCNHARDTMEEYVVRAIEGGIKHMGFSDHMPFVCADGHQSTYRVALEDGKKYIETVLCLADKYKEYIDIIPGFEMEYYPRDFQRMYKSALELGARYLILGEHFTSDESQEDSFYTFSATDSEDRLKEYVSAVTEGMGTGAFTYVAHPDIIKFVGDEAIYIREMSKICEASIKYNVPLEINFLGIREGRMYPRDIFWKIAGEAECSVTFGFDSHSAGSSCDDKSIEKAMELVNKYGLNYIGKPDIAFIQ